MSSLVRIPRLHFSALQESLRDISIIELAFVYGLSIPAGAISLSLKATRVEKFGELESFNAFLGLLKFDLVLFLAFTLLGLGILAVLKNRWLKSGALIALQMAVIVFTILEISAHNYYMITGSTLDFQLVSYTITNFDEVFSVLASESGAGTMLLFVFGVSGLLFLPWVLILALGWQQRTPTFKRKFRTISIYLFSFSLLCYSLLFNPNFAHKDKIISQNAVFNILDSYISYVGHDSMASEHHWEAPIATRLVSNTYARKKKNLVFLILESVRADSTSLHNKRLDTTPFMKSLLPKSLFAQRMYSVIPRTSKSLVSIHCGIEPRPSMPIRENEKGGVAANCLPTLLNEVGYDTAYFQTAWKYFENRPGLVRNLGHTDFYPGDKLPKAGYEETNYFGYEDKIMIRPSLRWHKSRKNKDKPFMVTYLTNTTHHNYVVPSSIKKKRYRRNKHFNNYLNCVRYVDSFVEKVFAEYKKNGLYEDTIFVIVGDHGEGFWEHRLLGHSNTIYEEGVRVPLIIHDASRFKRGRKITRVLSQIDLLPTVVDLMGFEVKGGQYRGYNILSPRENYDIKLACWHEKTCIASLNDRLVKYIHHFGTRRDEVFDLKSDPKEKRNIFSAQTSVPLVDWYNNLEQMYQMRHESKI